MLNLPRNSDIRNVSPKRRNAHADSPFPLEASAGSGWLQGEIAAVLTYFLLDGNGITMGILVGLRSAHLHANRSIKPPKAAIPAASSLTQTKAGVDSESGHGRVWIRAVALAFEGAVAGSQCGGARSFQCFYV